MTMADVETVTISYVRNGETRQYTFTGTALERDREISIMLKTEGVTAVWFE